MPQTCSNCGSEFPYKKEIDGDIRNLSSRQYCLDCSEFKSGNTKQIHRENQGVCKVCGSEFDPDSSTGNTTVECSKCISKRRRYEIKSDLVSEFGGVCECCGYDDCISALSFHHKDPSEKEFKISSGLTSRTKESLITEAEKCVLLCSNCHREKHCKRC